MTISLTGRISTFAMDDRALDLHDGTIAARQTESRLRLLVDTGLQLASQRSLDGVVQTALDAGLRLCDAAFGAFVSHPGPGNGEGSPLYKAAGIDPAVLRPFALSRAQEIFAERSERIFRSDDIALDPRYKRDLPIAGATQLSVPLRSYLAAPVRGRGGEILGVFLYGHPEAAVFHAPAESLIATVAAQTAVAMDNARLTDRLTREVGEAGAARAALRDTGRRLRQALDAAQLGTWRWNAETGMVDFDERAAALFGVEPGVPHSRDRLREQVVHRDDMAFAPADLRDQLRAGGQYTAEYRVRALDGVQRWLSVHGNAALSETTGQVIGMIGTMQDITSRKQQEESLRTSEKLAATGRLAATIAHEINNPLEAVTNLIYLAKTDPATPASISRMLETADGELARVSQIAQQTLGFYRDTTRPASIDLNEMLNTVVDLFGRKLQGKRLRCTLDLEPGLAVTGLQGEIRQVVSNLLVNAIDACPPDGSVIRIRGRHRRRGEHRGVSVMIADEGSGIPPHIGRRLFTPFVTTKESTGTGLGLWVTRGMVEKHGGSIRFRSSVRSPSGTVFRVYLPQSGSSALFASQTTPVLQ